MQEVGRVAAGPVRVYLTGGACAVWQGWRPSTLDVDVRFEPDSDRILSAVPSIKDRLHLNVELASPADFIPPLPGWEARSVFIGQYGKASFYHYDFTAQALSKLERGHAQDREDVRSMVLAGLVRPADLLAAYGRIEGELYRYPALDPVSFRRKVETFVSEQG